MLGPGVFHYITNYNVLFMGGSMRLMRHPEKLVSSSIFLRFYFFFVLFLIFVCLFVWLPCFWLPVSLLEPKKSTIFFGIRTTPFTIYTTFQIIFGHLVSEIILEKMLSFFWWFCFSFFFNFPQIFRCCQWSNRYCYPF